MIDQLADQHSVAWLCPQLGVARSGFYAWRQRQAAPGKRAAGKRADENARLTAEIQAVFQEHRGFYGSPRVHPDLCAAGLLVGRHRVARLMQRSQLKARTRKPFRHCSSARSGAPGVVDNLLLLDVQPPAPNRCWAGDITSIRTTAGWRYLAVWIDLFSRRVSGWKLDQRMDTSLVIEDLHRALGHRQVVPEQLLLHTDQGSQYRASSYRQTLEKHAIASSMSSKGCCWDNAVVESFFSTLKLELNLDDNRKDLISPQPLQRNPAFWIEGYYNRERRHSTIGYMSPINDEQRFVATPKLTHVNPWSVSTKSGEPTNKTMGLLYDLRKSDGDSTVRKPQQRTPRNNPKVRKVETPPSGIDLQQVAHSCCYEGSPYHKDTPSFVGSSTHRPDASICPRELANRHDCVETWLRQAVKAGHAGGWQRGYPRYVWHRDQDGTIYEARQGSPGFGK